MEDLAAKMRKKDQNARVQSTHATNTSTGTYLIHFSDSNALISFLSKIHKYIKKDIVHFLYTQSVLNNQCVLFCSKNICFYNSTFSNLLTATFHDPIKSCSI